LSPTKVQQITKIHHPRARRHRGPLRVCWTTDRSVTAHDISFQSVSGRACAAVMEHLETEARNLRPCNLQPIRLPPPCCRVCRLQAQLSQDHFLRVSTAFKRTVLSHAQPIAHLRVQQLFY
jgi:hypothetical protein